MADVPVPSIEVVEPDPTASVLGVVAGGVVKNMEAGPSFGQLASPATVPAYAFSADEAQSIFDDALPLSTYADLLAYDDRATGIRITGVYGTSQPGIAGTFRYNPAAPNTTDGGMRFAHASGVGAWERAGVEYVFLPWFEAVGDGIADDTAAIVAAIASLPSTGGEIYTGRGKFLFTSTITINKPIIFRGAGAGTVNNGPTGTALVKSYTLNGDGVVLLSLGASLVTLSIQCQAGNGGDGLVVLESRCILDQVSVFGAGRDNIRIGRDATPSNVNLWQLWRIKTKNAGRHGLHISDKIRPTLPDANAGLSYGGDFQFNGECGIYLGNCAFNKFDGPCVQQNGTYGMRFSPSSMNNKVVGGDFEVNGRVGGSSSTSYFDIWIEPGSLENDLDGCNCYNFPVTFLDEGTRTKKQGVRAITLTAGDDQHAGLQLHNIESNIPTMFDVYEESISFTPYIEGETTVGTGTYSNQRGECTRSGNKAKILGTLTWSAHTGTGPMVIKGLPFTSKSNLIFQPATIVPDNITTPAGSYIVGMAPPNTASIKLWTVSTAGNAVRTALPMDTSGSLWFEMTMLIP